MTIETTEQLIGIIIGGLLGYIIAASKAGGSYRYLGDDLFEASDDAMGCVSGCLLEIVLMAIGAGAGYFIGSMFGN